MGFAAVYDVRDFRVVWPDGTMIKVEVPNGWGDIALHSNAVRGLPTDHAKMLRWRTGLGSYVSGPSRKVANRARKKAIAAGKAFSDRDYAVAYTTEANRRLVELGRELGIDLRVSVRQPNEGIEVGLRGARPAPEGLTGKVGRKAADASDADILLQAVNGKNPIFYSRLEQLAQGMPLKMGLNDVVSFLSGRGAKADEIKWTNVQEFLDDAAAQGKKSITKEELLGHLNNNRIIIEDTQIGPLYPNQKFGQFDDARYDAIQAGEVTKPVFPLRTLDGGREYREVKLRLPQPKGSEFIRFKYLMPHSRTPRRGRVSRSSASCGWRQMRASTVWRSRGGTLSRASPA